MTLPPKKIGAKGNPKRHDPTPRKSSPNGVAMRADRRAITAPKLPGYHKPGSHNPKKVGR